MNLPPFLLDRWLHDQKDPPIAFNLGGSTGLHWTLGDVLDFEPGSRERLFGSDVLYTPSAGTESLRAAMAEMWFPAPWHALRRSWRPWLRSRGLRHRA